MGDEPGARASVGERFASARAELAELCALVLEEVERGISAWNLGDTALAERVIEGDGEIDRRSRALEEEIMSIHLRWSAFGEDLRLLHVGLIQAVALERVGNLAVEIARLTMQTPPPLSDVERVSRRIERLGEHAVDALAAAAQGMARNDVEAADRARKIWDDAEGMLDAIITEVSRTFEEETSRRWSASAVLVARHMERIANNAAELGGRVRFLVTGRAGVDEAGAGSVVAD